MTSRTPTRVWRLLILTAALTTIFATAPALGAASTTDASEPAATSIEDAMLPNFTADGASLVRLLAGAFDPLIDPLPAGAGLALVDEAALPAGVSDYYLVQVAAEDFSGAQAAITSSGGALAGYVPDATYVVRATPAQADALRAESSVRWVGYYQPAWRMPSAVAGQPGLLDVAGIQTYRVLLFDTEPDLAAVRAAVASVAGATVVDEAEHVVEVRGTATEAAAIALIPGVQWVTLVPQGVLHNANARWVNDTGVRDTYAATADGRLTGAGQTAAVADTGINYTYDLNGRAHIGFRDCDADGSNCKEAIYTQTTPGSGSSAIFDIQDHGTNHRKMVAYFDLGDAGPQPFDPSSHGSHTGGSVTGDQGNNGVWDGHDGMAPGAMHVHQNVGTPTGGLDLPADDYNLWRQAYRPRDPLSVPIRPLTDTLGNTDPLSQYRPLEDARTHNNSYGLIVPLVDETSAARLDRFVWDHEDMVIVVSAANGGPGLGTVNSPAVAKNDMTSAASANGRQPMVSIGSIASFSSHGPTADGRLGPDLATPGQVVVSVKGGTEDGYHVAQGTSMSAPILTGLATLVRQYFFDGYGPTFGSGFAGGEADPGRSHNPSAALVKAAMVNGAERMRGYYSGDDGQVRALDGQWPSMGQGFGRVTLDNSLFFDGDAINNWYHDVWRSHADAFDVASAQVTREYTIEVASGAPLDVTLAWTDAPVDPGAGSPALVNDLNLQLVDPDGLPYAGNNMNSKTVPSVDVAETLPGPGPVDTKNNVERVRIADPAAGTWTIRVVAPPIALGRQGFALAASGRIGDGFTPGPGLFSDAAGSPTISNVSVEASSGDTAVVTFDTSEPTTATAEVDGVTYVDSYVVSDFHGLDEATVESSSDFLDRPMLGTSHEILLTGLTPGASVTVELAVEDLAGNQGAATTSFDSPATVFQADAPDIGQLVGGSSGGWRTGTQLYAGYNAGTGLLGAWAFRIPEGSVDPADVTGAAVEFSSAHDWVIRYIHDPALRVDLLDESVESAWGTQTYEDIDRAAADARAFAETTHLRGNHQLYSFAFTCSDLETVRSNLANGMLAFRYDTQFIEDTGIFSADFGFNRRSKGPQFRPRLVLYTGEDGHPGVQNCDPDTPAPTISSVGVKDGQTPDSVTVTWETDVPSNSLILFREQGTSDWIQVGSRALTQVHAIQVHGLDSSKDYEFAVRSEACNGATTTDANGGAGYSFFVAQAAPPVIGNPTVEDTFDFNGSDQGWTTENPGGTVQQWVRRAPGNGGLSDEAWWVQPYTDEMEVNLVSPPHTFGDEVGAVRYFVDHDTEETFDFLFVEYTIDGGATWRTLDAIDGLSLGFVEREATFDAPAGPVQVRFRFKSDLLVFQTGVGVDDVSFVSYEVITPGTEGADVPTSGPAPAPSAGASGLTPPATRTGAAGDADIAHGTTWCDVASSDFGNRDPVAEDDSDTTSKDTPVTIDVLANDSDPDGDPIAVSSVSDPANGAANDNGDGTITYTPDAGFVGTDTFTYTITDGRNGSDSATVTVEVTDQPPVPGEGRVHGSGHWLDDGTGKYDKVNFSFDAKTDKKKGLKGKLKVHDKDVDVKIDAKEITFLSDGAGVDCNGTILDGAASFVFRATGTFEIDDVEVADAEFFACGIDNGKPGKGNDEHDPDLLYVECASGCSYDTGSRVADDFIDGGNIHLHDPIVATSSSGSSGSAAAAAGSSGESAQSTESARSTESESGLVVVELDPMLLDVAVAGVPTVLTVATFLDGELGVLDGAAVTLSWIADDGSSGEATAVTDALGLAVFTVTPQVGVTEYIAWVEGLDSNPMYLTGI